jgi:peptidoglycan/LPS O-acetylase OafA/YrhL
MAARPASRSFPGARRLEEVLGGRDNNLNAIRMIAAAAVLVSHAYPIALGEGQEEPLDALTGASLGYFAVAVFFGISGLLIARSFERRRSMAHFTVARIFRLFPALAVVLLVTVVAGAFVTRLPFAEYVSQMATWTYVPANLSLAFLQYPLPGVFEENPYGPAINGSLWTLFYEVVCYAGVVVAGVLGVLRNRYLALALLMLAGAVYLATPLIDPVDGVIPAGMMLRFQALASLAFPFILGLVAYVWRDRLILSGWLCVALWLVAVAALGSPFGLLLTTMALVYATFFIAFIPKGILLSYNRLGDYSYGIYIYAFPVQQLIMYLAPDTSPAGNMLLAMPPTFLLAVLSWMLVEKRALAAAVPFGDWLASRLPARRMAPGVRT